MNSISVEVPNKQKYRELLLAALTVSSGSIDAISFLSLNRVFSAFMTGNVTFVGLRAAKAGGPDLVLIFSAMLAFAAGVVLSARIVGNGREAELWSRRITSALGISLIGHLVFVVLWFHTDGNPSVNMSCVLLAFWAFAMGMQSAAIRSLHVEGVFTTAATGTIMLLLGAFGGWRSTRSQKLRYARVLLSLFGGAAAGGLLLVHAHLFAPVLPFIITIWVVIVAYFAMKQTDQMNADA